MKSIVLFHGTSTKYLSSIKKKRLLIPRADSKRTNYEGKLLSDPNRVYLTDVYAVHFGIKAVERHGGNLLICRTVINTSILLPDSDFEDGGLHSLKFTDALKCLESTGCVSVAGPIPINKLYIVKGKLLQELKTHCPSIDTGLRHKAFRKRNEELLEYALWYADHLIWDIDRWIKK